MTATPTTAAADDEGVPSLTARTARAPAPTWRWVLVPVGVFLVSRLIEFAVVGVSLRVEPRLQVPWLAPDDSIVVGLSRWDASLFKQIADDGYTTRMLTNFFPLFPLLGRWLGRTTGWPTFTSLFVVANAFGLAALVAVYRVFRDLADARAATAGLMMMAAFPYAFFHSATYPESLMVFFTAVAVHQAMRGRYLTAGAALGLGVLARHLAGLAGLALLAAGAVERRRAGRSSLPPPARVVAGLVIGVAIACLYFGFLAIRFGDPLVWLKARGYWGQEAWWGAWAVALWPRAREPQCWLNIGASILPLVGVCMLRARVRADPRWRPAAAFGVALAALVWLTGLFGLGRYSASCWPAFLPLGIALARRPIALWAAVVLCGLGQCVMLYLFCHVYPIT